MSFQSTTDTEDLELERMVSQARLMTTAQFYGRDKNKGLTELGPTVLPAIKDGPKTLRKGQARTESIVADIPQWSKKSLR